MKTEGALLRAPDLLLEDFKILSGLVHSSRLQWLLRYLEFAKPLHVQVEPRVGPGSRGVMEV